MLQILHGTTNLLNLVTLFLCPILRCLKLEPEIVRVSWSDLQLYTRSSAGNEDTLAVGCISEPQLRARHTSPLQDTHLLQGVKWFIMGYSHNSLDE